MTNVTIIPVTVDNGDVIYRAVCGQRRSSGKTAGEALDAIREQLTSDENGTLVVVQERSPDLFFPQANQERLQVLMAEWRVARDRGTALDSQQQAELEALVDAELEAAALRTTETQRDVAH